VLGTLRTSLDRILAGQMKLIPGMPSGIQVVFRSKMPGALQVPGAITDIAVFDHSQRQVLVIELKDSDTFDTKKASGELASMTAFANWVSQETGYEAKYFFCSFNQDDKRAIVRGTKGRFDLNQVMTGRELCAILSIDYDDLRRRRHSEQSENLMYFLAELLKIDEIRDKIRELLKGGN